MENKEEQQIQDEELKSLLAQIIQQKNLEDDDDDDDFRIDWFQMFHKLLLHWKFICLFTFCFIGIGIGAALVHKKVYTVSVTMAPEVQGRSNNTLSGLASALGVGSIGTGNSSDALNISLFPQIIQSTTFLTGLFDIKVTPYVSEAMLQDNIATSRPITLLDYMTKDTWITTLQRKLKLSKDNIEDEDTIVNEKHLTAKQRLAIKRLTESIDANINSKTGITTVSVTVDDPQIATLLADTVCQSLQNYIRDYRTKKAKEDLDYYTKLSEEAKDRMVRAQNAYAVSVDFDRSVILQSVNSEKQQLQSEAQLAQQVYQQMETQKENAKAKYQELKPVFAVIQPATFPARPSNISRKMIVLAFMLVGGSLACVWTLLGADYWAILCQRWQSVKRKEAEET